MAKLHPLAAIAKAQEARSFLAAFAGHDFGEFAEAGHHDRRHLAAALDHMEELAAMVLALAEQVPNAKVVGPAEGRSHTNAVLEG